MRARKRGVFPAGLAGMLVLSVLTELWIGKHTPAWAHTIVQDWRAARASDGRDAAGCEVLCFGSSMVKFGVLPGVIESRTGRRGFNFALLNGPPPASYFLFKRALDSGARPRAVVVDFDHNRLQAPPDATNASYPWADLLRSGEVFDLARRARDPSLFARLTLAKAVPSVRRRFEVRAAVLVRLKGFTGPLETIGSAFGSKPAYARNRLVNRGALVNPAVAFPAGERLVENRSPEWSCHPVNADYVRSFLRLAGERGVAVYWLIPPVAPFQQEAYDRVHALDRYADGVRAFASEFPDLTVIDGRSAGFPLSAYIDHVHLNRDGASALSESLAALIDGPRPKSRWVDLPAYRAASGGGRVEDLAQSDAVLRASVRR